ncbi:MAG TPA: DHH family phosphoesterase [Lachnospiraceae bacterium]|nr:DHH family phosphoesterase [Lachnospiraceae bacterium]
MSTDRMQGILSHYLRWPLVLGILLIVMNIHIYTLNTDIGLYVSAYVGSYMILALLLVLVRRRTVLRDLVSYAMRFHVATKKLATEFEFPMCILDSNFISVWDNDKFRETFAGELGRRFGIEEAIPEIDIKSMPKGDESAQMHFHVDKTYYHATIKRLDIDHMIEGDKKVERELARRSKRIGISGQLFVLYVFDETDLVRTIQENYDQRLDVGLLYIDNYEESLDTVDDVRRALLIALVDRKINKYMLSHDAIIRKLEKDKYIFLLQHKYLAEMQADKFSLLEDIKSVNSGVAEETSITISMGIGSQIETYRKRQEYARSAIDLALGRGGDQVVIKTKDNTLYYGGKSIEQEKNTRVKARVKAHALRDSIEVADRLIIMGHNMPDVDAIGSALGIYRIATDLGKPARIVVDSVTSALEPLLKLFKGNKDYPDDLFLNAGQAAEYVGNGAGVLLVVVDVNRPSYTDAPGLIDKVSSIVVIDHHRQTGETFNNPTLSYVEPFASSACEMVAEIVQYSGDEVRLKTLEADALYSGIMVDTNNFMNKPGVRTFEAVAFLRRSGAEMIRIRKMFRTDIEEYKVQAEAVRNMSLFMDAYAIAPCRADNFPDPTIIGSKIANTFLDIQGVKASFVLTEYAGKIFISARSIDELNVQLVMEKLGGGGHINMAGAQLTDCTLEEGIERVKEVLTEMRKDGDID